MGWCVNKLDVARNLEFSIQIKSQSMPSTVDTTSDSSTTRDFSEMDFSRMSLQELKQSIRSKPAAKREWLHFHAGPFKF